MRLTLSRKKILWILWILITPTAFAVLYMSDPPRNMAVASLVTVAFVYLITVFFSFKVGRTDIILLQGIGLAALLIFGLFIQALLTELAITVYLFTQRLNWADSYRIPLNMLMFLGMSITEGAVYYLLGGEVHPDKLHFLLNNAVPVFGFYLASYMTNEILLYVFRRWLIGSPSQLVKPFEKDSVWEIVATVMMMPMGVAFYTLYAIKGLSGMFLIAVPMVALSIIIRLFNSSQQMSEYLQRVNYLGQKLTEALSADHIIELLLKELPSMLDVDYGYIVLYDVPDQPRLICQYRKENDGIFVPYQIKADVSFDVYHSGKATIGSRKKDMYPYIKALSQNKVRSFLSVPMFYQGKVIGVLTFGTSVKSGYSKTHRIGLEIVGNFLAIALRNAHSFEITKKESEHCPLTGLYNYRYLIAVLNKRFEMSDQQTLSIIMFDIDNFKQINDQYGHQNGNDVLIGVANRLLRVVGHRGMSVRYGGEEFTIVLPNVSCHDCFALAEKIRQSIADEPFMIYLDQEHRYKSIDVTISVGTATAPQDADEPFELIRKADHAMYSGAKRMGKNRVSRYG